ncbi:hypothetical protein DER46DRAFT_687554 [Fusarium sp. MPI-SDFR-AT-0072]|nr:hypothetical protein DER46DRAFT_687554 [Fusarium sp. MPI-SDFR-AT-0072]
MRVSTFVVEDNSKKDLPVEHRADLRNYVRNKGRVWFHELLHIDWASGVFPAYHITDISAYFLDEGGFFRCQLIYDLEMNKGLARYKFDPAFFIRRNADSFAMYAMAKCVQKAVGKYPHLPLAITLDDVDDGPSLLMTGDMTIDLQGKTPDDEDGPGKKRDVVPFNSSAWFWGNSVYTEDYQRQLRGWLADVTSHHNRVRIVSMQTAMGPLWMAFQDTPDEPIKDFCTAKILARAPAEGDEHNLKFPTKLPAFDAHAAKGCNYSGTSDLMGGLSCEPSHFDIEDQHLPHSLNAKGSMGLL